MIPAVASDLDVTFISPLFAPGVLHQPEVLVLVSGLALLSTVTDDQNSMVQILAAAFRLVVNT